LEYLAVDLESLGCTKDLIDNEIMFGRLDGNKIIDDQSKADIMIVNIHDFIQKPKV
jgi:tRNA A37 methylthiotransferase MiaB